MSSLHLLNEQEQALLEHGTLLLTVNLKTVEDAREILEWMYATRKPMTSELIEIAWDKVAVSKQVAEALAQMRKAMRESGNV
jgi:hypothetical protein